MAATTWCPLSRWAPSSAAGGKLARKRRAGFALVASLSSCQFLQVLGKPTSFYFHLRRSAFDLAQIILRQFDLDAPTILFQPLQFCCAWDWNDPRLLGEPPGERDPSRRRVLSFCNLA